MVTEFPRRGLLLCAGGAALCAVAGCSHQTAGTPAISSPTKVAPAESASPAPPPGPVTIKAGDVPVGSGILVDAGDGVLVTQPTPGHFKAFSAICPHEGCLVSEIRDGEMICPCHSSRFEISDGAVTRGPARTGLDPVAFTVANGQITVEPASAPPPSFSG